ncbi:WD40-repeat-containing domain protein [Clohesyomyces aquaticus]|uniref:WD40-repeat-containing domain protein n=1 Tax=Clohesyomyces aquaticus TaxID=1231657 RepID=A0A1Y1Z267_9PLEO|nr:WD40-repeat-containing domain protein [Clohesyomyces aquaticus]
MVASHFLYAFAGLLEVTLGRSVSPRQTNSSNDLIPIPKFKFDFKKADVPAQWATGYPKKWGSEDSRLQFNVPIPEDIFNGVLTDDEKYVGMFNGSHAMFVDLDTRATISTFSLGPADSYNSGLTVRKTSNGEYDVFITASAYRYASTSKTVRRHLTKDFQPVGEESFYDVGDIKAFDKDGRMATTDGYIIDVGSTNITIKLKNPPKISDMSFSSDGQYLSTVGWQDMSADLWNTTSGDRILQFPATNAQNWVTRISPDNKYVLISLGTGSIQLYSLANLTAQPTVLSHFNNWIRNIEWSPDGKYLATGDDDRLQLWKFPEAVVVQTWEVYNQGAPTYGSAPYGIVWMDGGSKISWSYRYGRYMYDFEKNERYWFTPGLWDHSWGGNGISFLKKKGLVMTVDGDSFIRFWKV